MRYRLITVFVCMFMHLALMNSVLKAESCVGTWISPDPDQIYGGSRIWQQSLPLSCQSACARITVTLKVLNYNDVGSLDLYCSNTSSFDYGNPTLTGKKLGWIGRINVPPSFVSPDWKTVSFTFRLPHIEWLNDNGSAYIALLGPEYFQGGVRAQFQVDSSTIETIPWDADIDDDGDIDGGDLTNLAVDYGCTGSCAADFDANGVVDENDLLAFADEFAWSGCPLGFYESFNDGSANNWLRTAPWSVSDSVYKMNGTQPTQPLWQYGYYNQVFDDFSFEASVKQIEGGQGYVAGIFFRSDSFNNRYSFFITAVGQYTIVKTVSGVDTILVPWTAGNYFKGYNVWNRLGVTCTGSTLKFFINQSLVETVTDTGMSSGVAGLIAVDSNTEVSTFHFDDVLLEEK